MSQNSSNLDDIIDVREVTTGVLHTISERIRLSSTWEHMVYRENEIDQVWRLIDRPKPLTDLQPHILAQLRANIMAIHDLIGVEHRPQDAAQMLTGLLEG